MKRIVTFFVLEFLCISIISNAAQLRIGVLKIEDAAPVVIAHNDGIFKRNGIDTKIIYFNSALERDAALQANAVDCVITDPVASILLKSSGYDIKIVSVALGVSPKDGVFSFLVSPKSNIKTLEDLNNKTLAISKNSIIEYVADRTLSLKHIKVKKINIRKMPLRVQMLLDSQVDAAILPEPLATYAKFKYAKVVFSDSMLEKSLSQTVWIFNTKFLNKNPDVIKQFKVSYNQAVESINKNPDKYKSTITLIARVPKAILSIYKIPHFSYFKPLNKDSYRDYQEWLIEKGLLKKPVPYSSIVYVTSN